MLEEEDRKIYEALQPPKSIVVRYGYQKLVAELPYDGTDKPGCGSKLVVRTQRGTELAEMLTTTCANSGCSKSVSRKEMLQYIENSGGKDFPFTDQGRVLRVAEVADLNEQARLDARKPEVLKMSKQFVKELDLKMKPVETELLLGGERIIIYYTAEQWVDFRELVKMLAGELQTRIEMHQVNDREEARLVADYERCGQYCCCKNFLKVLKPVSMRSAKVQKATLDPQKISGRCGRLMCCLRYEDETYETLRKKLPHRKTVVETEDGIGIVIGSQILTQLVLVKIAQSAPAAYPLENIRILNKQEIADWNKAEDERLEKAQAAFARRSRSGGGSGGGGGGRSRNGGDGDSSGGGAPTGERPPRSRGRRDRSANNQPGNESDQPQQADQGPNADDTTQPAQSGESGEPGQGGKRRKRRRRRGRRRKPGGGGEGGGEGGNTNPGNGPTGGPPSSGE
jgi:cell fate regulator YaaT (PSP1 superfamily)